MRTGLFQVLLRITGNEKYHGKRPHNLLHPSNTKKCTVLRSMYSFYYSAVTCFDIITILMDLTMEFRDRWGRCRNV